MENVYFDNAATTRLDEEVLSTMMPYLKDEYGFSNSDLIIFKDMIVLNYITNIEQKEYDETEVLYRDWDDFIEKDEVGYKKIEKMIKDIYKEYPKWEKFGNI